MPHPHRENQMVDMDLLLALRSHAQYRPNQLAVAYRGRRLTYRQLAHRVSLFVDAFRRRGFEPGRRIGIATYWGTLPFEIYLAAQAAGLLPVTLSMMMGKNLPAYGVLAQVKDVFLSPQAAAIPGIESLEMASQVWHVDEQDETAGGFLTGSETPDENWIPRRDPEAISGIQFTSGTTGKPKGVLRSVRSDLWDGWHKSYAYQAIEGDCWLVITPKNLAIPLGALRPMLLTGGSVVCIPQYSADETIATISDYNVTILPMHWVQWADLLERPDAGMPFMTRLRTVSTLGQRTPVHVQERLAEAFPNSRRVINYGTTETSTISVLPSTDPFYGKPACVGKPLPTIEVEIADRADGHTLGIGERGEIRLRGPAVMPGYDLSLGGGENAVRAGWFYTGDVGEWDGNGNLYVVDRWIDVFESGGHRIYPGEVRERLYPVSGVRDVAVANVESLDGPRATAFVQPTSHGVTVESIRAAIAEVSSAPFDVRLVTWLPKTLEGKLDGPTLRAGTFADAHAWTPHPS